MTNQHTYREYNDILERGKTCFPEFSESKLIKRKHVWVNQKRRIVCTNSEVIID